MEPGHVHLGSIARGGSFRNFVDPCVVVDGHYILPEAPGYSAQMCQRSLAEFGYPDGGYWRSRTPRMPAAGA
jgi:hypothetical protein